MRVFVTGMGAITSLGNSVDDMFDGLLAGKTGVKYMPEWSQYKGLNSHLAAPAMPYDIKSVPRIARRSMSRMSEMGLLAAQQAVGQSDLNLETLQPERALMIMGSTSGSPDTMELYFKKLFERGGPEGQVSTSFFKVMNHSVPANVASAMGFHGALLSPSCACATSTQAIVLGWELIRSGLYDVVIAGGADELHYTSTAVFDIVMAASRGYNDTPDLSPRPFDTARDGLVVSEGASAVILESEASAHRRGVRRLAEVLGGAYLCDASHMSQSSAPTMVDVMNLTLKRSGLNANQIGYVNAHATGTLQGDTEEAKAIGTVFGPQIPVSTLKGHFGHSLAACGALEVISCIKMMETGKLIPTRNLVEVDPDCAGVKHVKEVTEHRVEHVLSNNFAFGGMNVSLVLSKTPEV